MSELAIFGGPKTVTKSFLTYNSIGQEEVDAAKSVVETGILSDFLGTWSPQFFGGQKVQALERAWEKSFKVKHAVTVNSNTSGLIAALGAVGVEPGDEVIVSPWTMSASASSILVWNAIPVFADIEDKTFNLDPVSIEQNISPYTKAIMVSDIFGHAADLDAIMAIANKHNLKVIEDSAQAPGAYYKGKYVGTIADIGVYSLNYHKHIHTGEGGICVTNSSRFAERMQLIRNHGEAVVEEKGVEDLSNMIGFNLRMTEIEAAIGIEQLKKLDKLVAGRIRVANKLTAGLKGLAGLRLPVVKDGCTHVYYVYPLVLDELKIGLHRDKIVSALEAEGLAVSGKYCNLHLLPMYQKKVAYGSKGFPWNTENYKGDVSYSKGICPVAEKLQDSCFFQIGMCVHDYSTDDIILIINAFQKIWRNLNKLKAGR